MDNIDLSKCQTRWKKIAFKHIVKEYYITLEDKSEMIVNVEHFGQNKIDAEKERTAILKEYWDKVVVNDEKVKALTKISEADELQTSMDGVMA